MKYEIELLHNLLMKAVRKANNRTLRRKEKRLQTKINGIFKDQIKTILNEYGKTKSFTSDANKILKHLGDKELIEDITASQKEVMTLGAVYRIKKDKLSRIGINFKLDHPLAVDFIKDKSLELANLSETTKDHIRPILATALENGTASTELARQLQENFAFSESRSLMISVHELGDAYEHGNYIPLQDAKDKGYNVYKKWQTVNDDRVTEECMANQDEDWIELDESFSSGDDRPPRSGNPRCRCTMLDKIT